MTDGSWTVAAIVKEPLILTLRFVAWYRAIGATHIALYFHDPDDPAIKLLSGARDISCIPCSPSFWSDLGRDPTAERFTRLQNAAMTHAYRTAKTQWVLNVDADEFLMLRNAGVGQLLAAMPETVNGICVEPAEVVQTTTQTGGYDFRLPMPPHVVDDIYRDDAKFVAPRRGLVGHEIGKSFTRTGLRLKIRQHWGERRNGARVQDAKLGPEQGAFLLHFLDLDYGNWRRKLEWRRTSRGFSNRTKLALRHADAAPNPEVAYRRLYEKLHVFDEVRLARLKGRGYHLNLSLDFDSLVAEQLSLRSTRPNAPAAGPVAAINSPIGAWHSH